MCLHIGEKDVIKTAKRSIRVYKVLYNFFTGDRYASPYRNSPYFRGETKTSRLIIPKRVAAVNIGLHSFRRKTDANCHARYGLYTIVAVMYIPKGSRYISGLFNGSDGYASDQLEWRSRG